MIFLLIIIYIVFISLGLPDSLFGVVWPVLHTEFGIAESFASVYTIIIAVTTGGVSFFAGRLIRKFGTGKVTFASILLTAVGLIGISFSPNIVFMIIFSIIMGYGAGAIDTGLNNYVSLHYKARHMNWLHCFWGVGVTASPIIMSFFLTGETGSWRRGYQIIAIIQLVIAAAVAASLGKWENAPATEETEKKGEPKGNVLLSRGVIPSILTLGAYCSMEFLVGTWGATYIVNSLSLSPDTAAKWVSLYYGGIMFGRFISGFISLKASDKALIRGGIIASFAGMLVLALPIGSASLFGLLLIGTGFGPIFPCMLHSIPGKFGKEFSADLTGYHMGGAYAVGFLTQLIFGYVASATTFAITPFVLIGLSVTIFTINEITTKILKAA